jgi:hypothetical protein
MKLRYLGNTVKEGRYLIPEISGKLLNIIFCNVMYSYRAKIVRLLGIIMMCLVFSKCLAIDETVKSASQKKEVARTNISLDGIVTNLVTRRPIADIIITIDGKKSITDANGFYSITGILPGTSRMELTGSAIITRSLMVNHENSGSLDVSVKASNFNNSMFWASAGLRGHIMRWQTPPKWVIYSHLLDSQPPELFQRKDMAYLICIIKKELPQISDFFNNPHIEIFSGRPNDDPRWTGKKRANGHILCAPVFKGGGYANWKARRGPYVRYAKIRNNFKRSAQTWRHEIAHALGMGHAYDNKTWLPLGDKDPNYEHTKLHDNVEYYTAWDKLWLRCVYSGNRPAGNAPPDRDPNDCIHIPVVCNEN